MEFNVVNNNSHISEMLLGNESNASIYHEENIHTHHHAGGNFWQAERHTSTPIIDDSCDDNNMYYDNDHDDNFITENNFGVVGGGDVVANDIEIIAIDPNQEYSSDDGDEEGDETDDNMSVFEADQPCESSPLITIESVKAALQASGHSRVARQSLSLPHSPTRYSMDFSGISFDDLDIHSHFPDLMTHNTRPLPIVDSVDATKSFDLASYITQDDNFEVISPSKVLAYTNPVQENYVNNSYVNITPTKSNSLPISMHNNHSNAAEMNTQQETTSRKRRTCVLSSKRMHYQVPSDDDDEERNNNNNSSGSDNEDNSYNNVENEEIERPDNTKVDPTWMPFKAKDPKPIKLMTAKNQKIKEPKMKKAKSVPVKSTNKVATTIVKGSASQKNLLKVCKSTSRTRMLNAAGQLPKDKIHKITKTPAGKSVNLDHDYCSAKQKPEMFRKVSQRKAIEIPIVVATIDKKLSKSNKKNESSKSSSIKKSVSNEVQVSCDAQTQVSLLKSSHVTETTETVSNPSSVRRKLNLSEYMQRREIRAALDEMTKEVENPILAAKRKVLRKQELKKEAKMKDMEPKIENVPLLPILPLAEITGQVESTQDPKPIRVLINPNYEEIVIVSMGVNTEISVPPAADDEKSLLAYVNDTIKKVKDRVKDKRDVQFSNSLISSIQDVVLKKGNASLPTDIASPDCGVTPTHGMSPGKPETAKSNSPSRHFETATGKHETQEIKEHGEDKVIMHLRKDRKRPETRTTSVQTLDVPSFVPLRRLSPMAHARQSQNRSSRRSRSKETNCRTRSRSQHYRRSASRHSSRQHFSRSRSRNSESSTCSSTSSSSSSSASTSSSFKRGTSPARHRETHKYYNSASSRRSSSSYSSRSRSRESNRYRPVSRGRNCNRSRQNEDPEKRNIVYVGQLEHDLTKEVLRKKFLPYGHVTNVSLHLKENGMRYGFVTFSKPEQAYHAIDTSSDDPNLNSYDISFGGRRAFCGSHYADLDGLNSYINYHQISYPIEPYEATTVKKHEEAESFEDMLKKLKASINAKKPTTS